MQDLICELLAFVLKSRSLSAIGWNLLDVVVVFISIVSLGPNALLNMTVIRMLRTLRVVRLFGRVESLKKVWIFIPFLALYLVLPRTRSPSGTVEVFASAEILEFHEGAQLPF